MGLNPLSVKNSPKIFLYWHKWKFFFWSYFLLYTAIFLFDTKRISVIIRAIPPQKKSRRAELDSPERHVGWDSRNQTWPRTWKRRPTLTIPIPTSWGRDVWGAPRNLLTSNWKVTALPWRLFSFKWKVTALPKRLLYVYMKGHGFAQIKGLIHLKICQ